VTLYPTVEETLVVHTRLISKFGGSDGIRDRGALESALARPQSGYYTDLIQEAAETGRMRFDELDRWLRRHTTRLH
jgi:death on curing protein